MNVPWQLLKPVCDRVESVLNVLWPMQEQAVSRAQAAFDAFEENNECWEPGQSMWEPIHEGEFTCQHGKQCYATSETGDEPWTWWHYDFDDIPCSMPPLGGGILVERSALPKVQSSAGSAVSAASTQPPRVDGPGEVERSALPATAPSPRQPSTVDWLIPAITDVLADHLPGILSDGRVRCESTYEDTVAVFEDWQDWREHVAPLIATRVVESLAAQRK